MLLQHFSSALSSLALVGHSLSATVPNVTDTSSFELSPNITLAENDMSIQSGCGQGHCPENQKEKWDFLQVITPYIPRVGIRIDRTDAANAALTSSATLAMDVRTSITASGLSLRKFVLMSRRCDRTGRVLEGRYVIR
jgi:hypothetical protein